MKLTRENTSKIGKPAAIYDATGEEVLDCIACDMETGEVERFVLDDKGDYIIDGPVARTIKEKRPAPLRVEWLKENDG